MAFYQKLKAERDRTYQDKDKAKGLYDDSCMEIQNIRNKIAKGTGDQEKVLEEGERRMTKTYGYHSINVN